MVIRPIINNIAVTLIQYWSMDQNTTSIYHLTFPVL